MRVEEAFAVFDQQDSGCLSYGIERPAAVGSSRPRPSRPPPGLHHLGRTLQQLLTDDRSTDRERAVTARATDPDPGRRHPTVAALVADWRS